MTQRNSDEEKKSSIMGRLPGMRLIWLCLAFVLALTFVSSHSRAADPQPTTPEKAVSATVTAEEPTLLAERLRGFAGIAVILGLAYAISSNRRAISLRVVLWGLALQWAFALVVLRVP